MEMEETTRWKEKDKRRGEEWSDAGSHDWAAKYSHFIYLSIYLSMPLSLSLSLSPLLLLYVSDAGVIMVAIFIFALSRSM